MQIHPDVLEVLKKEILPNVIRIHDFDVPWPAKLRSGNPYLSDEHKHGAAMFNIGSDGYLNAEYFSYDDGRTYISWEAILTMADTEVEIHNYVLGLNPKITGHYHGSTPEMTAYNLMVKGWIGGSIDSKTSAAHITILGLPELHLPHIEPSISNENDLVPIITRQGNTGAYTLNLRRHQTQGVTSKNFILEIGPGDWSIQLMESPSSWEQEAGKLYHATVAKRDGEPFTLGDERIGDALYKFLSFQAGRWITAPTTVCEAVEADNQMSKYAYVSRLTSGGTPLSEFRESATAWRKWPNLFQEFLRLYNDPVSHQHLQNAVYHYVEANQVLHNASTGQALVAAQSTLQALTRWWNGLETEFRFGLRNGPTFEQLLIKAVQEADLGNDSGARIDEEALKATVEEAADYRNDIDHGRGGNLVVRDRSVVELQMHHQNLARLLILAKLGDRDQDHRKNFRGPKFMRVSD